jgi:AraC-like DNA-binding protein
VLLTTHPASPLRSYVDSLWYYEGFETTSQTERVLPNGRFQIVIDLTTGAGMIGGLRSTYIEIQPAKIHAVMGVSFQPGGAHGFFDVPASDFYNELVALDDAWPAEGLRELRDRLHTAIEPRARLEILEAMLLRSLRRGTLHPATWFALQELHRAPHIQTVSALSTGAGLSRRRFSQLFRDQVGMTPKLYCRLTRFRRVLRAIRMGRDVDWAGLALAGGYSDQAHLIHEFRAFSGMAPGSYVSATRPHENHVRVD